MRRLRQHGRLRRAPGAGEGRHVRPRAGAGAHARASICSTTLARAAAAPDRVHNAMHMIAERGPRRGGADPRARARPRWPSACAACLETGQRRRRELRDYGIGAQILLDLGVQRHDPAVQHAGAPSSASRAMGCTSSSAGPIQIGSADMAKTPQRPDRRGALLRAYRRRAAATARRSPRSRGGGDRIRRVDGARRLRDPRRHRFAALAAARHGPHFDGFVALGCVIRGETSHYDHVCAGMRARHPGPGARNGLAVGFGVLTVENEAQALARARRSTRRNKGGEAARACLAMIALKRSSVSSRRDRPVNRAHPAGRRAHRRAARRGAGALSDRADAGAPRRKRDRANSCTTGSARDDEGERFGEADRNSSPTSSAGAAARQAELDRLHLAPR